MYKYQQVSAQHLLQLTDDDPDRPRPPAAAAAAVAAIPKAAVGSHFPLLKLLQPNAVSPRRQSPPPPSMSSSSSSSRPPRDVSSSFCLCVSEMYALSYRRGGARAGVGSDSGRESGKTIGQGKTVAAEEVVSYDAIRCGTTQQGRQGEEGHTGCSVNIWPSIVLLAPYLNARKAFSVRNVRSATSGTESSCAGAVTVTVCRHSWRA